MKKFIIISMLISACLHGIAQDGRSAQTLNLIIEDGRSSPESRVLACVRQGEYYINKPNKGAHDLDSASVSLKRGEQLSKYFNLHAADGELLFLAGIISKHKGLRKEWNRLNDQALTYLRKKPGNDFLGRALLEKGDYLNTDDDKQLTEKITLLKEAIACFQTPGYVQSRAAVWKMLGDLYQLRTETSGNIARALDAYQRSKDAYFSYGERNVQDIYIEMASMYKYLGDNQQGLRYCLLAIQTAERANDVSLTLCEIYNYTGLQYMALLDYANAKKYFVLAMELAEKFNDKRDVFTIAPNLIQCYSTEKEYDKMKLLIDRIHSRFPENDVQNQNYLNTFYLRYYTETNNLGSGKKFCSRLINLMSDATPPVLRFTGRVSYSAISDYYTMAHDFSNAYKFWDKAYSTTLQYDYTPANMNKLIYSHYKIDTTNHNLASGISYLQQYSNLRDSIYTINKARQEANLKVLYDTQKKEYELAESRKQIKMLKQNEQLQRANLKQAVLIRNITTGFTIVVIIVSVLLYRMVRLHKKAGRKIAKSNSLLEKLVSEKEWLLREIHHRVKNNLHTIICLLESQAAYLQTDALQAIENSKHRIYAMSLIHQKLYENEDMKTIDMNDYVSSLVHYLQDCFDLKNNITFRLEITPILIHTSIAIPISLIINEAITNSIKYAFANGGNGEIVVKLFEDHEKIIVVMADNGAGIDLALINNSTPSMGLRLIRGLCGDIGGMVTFNNKNGTEIRLICPRVLIEDENINIENLLNNIPNAVES